MKVACAALMLAAALPGCIATTGQVDRVEARVATVERTNSSVIAEAKQATVRLENLAKDYDQVLAELREATARANTRQSDFDRLIKQLRGEVEVLTHRLESIEKAANAGQVGAAEAKARLSQLIADLRDRAGIAILAMPAQLPADGPGFVAMAEQSLAAGEIRTAAAVAVECQKRYPGTESAGGCGLVLGRIAEQEQRYGDAMKILQSIHDSLGGKPLPIVGQALLQIAHLLELEGKCARSQEVYKYLRGEMGKLPAAKAAKDLQASQATRCKEGVNTQGKAVTAPADGGSPATKPAEPEAKLPAPGAKAAEPGSKAPHQPAP